jgi:hypothetical protein
MAFVGFDTVSKGPYHNYYGVWGVNPGSAGPTTGSGVPNAKVGDLYYNDGSVPGGVAGLYVCTLGGAFGVAVWTLLAAGTTLDKRESRYIVGNTANGDSAINSDFLDGPGLRSAIKACAESTPPLGVTPRQGGRIYIREGAYISPQAGTGGFSALGAYVLGDPSFGLPLTTGIWIDGAGREAVTITNNVLNACPLFVLNYNGVGGNETFPVRLSHMTLVGNGSVNANPGVGGNGFATVEVGLSNYQAAGGGVAPQAKQNVTIEDVDIDAGGDACGLVLVADSAGTSNGCNYFRGIDLHVYNAICTFDAKAQMEIADLITPDGSGTQTYYMELVRVTVDNINVGAAKGAGMDGAAVDKSSLSECWANSNMDGGFFFTGCVDLSFDQCRAMNNNILLPGTGAAGFGIGYSASVRLESCYAQHNLRPNFGGDDFFLDNCNNCLLESCIADGTMPPLNIVNNGITFRQCTLCIASACESFYHVDAETPVFPSAGIGFQMNAGSRCEFIGCQSHDNGVHGFFLWAPIGGCSMCMVNDCTATANGRFYTLGQGHGIYVSGTGSERVLINDCIGYYNGGHGARLDVLTQRCEIVGGAYIANGGTPSTGPYGAQVYDAVGGLTTNELSHFQFQ